MSNIIKKIEKQTENISNKAKNKFKLEMKEIIISADILYVIRNNNCGVYTIYQF